MTIKTYSGESVADALAQVKRDLGTDAVILHTRTYKARGRLGVGGAKITEITATTEACLKRRRTALSERARRTPAAEPVTTPAAPAVPDAPAMTVPLDPPQPMSEPPAPAVAETPREDPRETEHARELAQRLIARQKPDVTPEPRVEAPASPVQTSLRDELASIRTMVGQVLNATRGSSQPSMPEPLFDCYLNMINAEVAAEVADAVVGAVRDQLTPAELTRPDVVRPVVLRQLAAYIQATDEPPPMQRTPDGRPFTLALVGPTGVGKTTTIAKLAATYKLRHGRKIGLVTSDTYRIAAVEQLRTYANIIGLNLQVALTPAEMAAACERCADCDAILIDTAGRSPRDTARLDELRQFLDAARPHETHLVLSSSMGEAVMRDAAKRFAPIGPDHLIFTKLDEAVNFGVLVNIGQAIDARLSFVTTGQEVPDHIECGNAERLARLVLEQEDVR